MNSPRQSRRRRGRLLSPLLVSLTNNATKYEALLANQRISLTLQARQISFYSDLYVIVRQIQGVFQAKEKTLQMYQMLTQILIR